MSTRGTDRWAPGTYSEVVMTATWVKGRHVLSVKGVVKRRREMEEWMNADFLKELERLGR